MKTIIREILAMTVLVASIGLITVLVFFDYIKGDANQPQAAIYEISKEEQNILKEKEEYEEDKETLVLSSMYSVDESTLSSLKASGEFKQGQSSPFDEAPIIDVRYDSEGNAYYQVNNRTNTTNNTTSGNSTNNITNNVTNNTSNTSNTTNTTNTNNTTNQPQALQEDITTSSASSGSLMLTQKNDSKK